jgi:hypothetical protein
MAIWLVWFIGIQFRTAAARPAPVAGGVLLAQPFITPAEFEALAGVNQFDPLLNPV